MVAAPALRACAGGVGGDSFLPGMHFGDCEVARLSDRSNVGAQKGLRLNGGSMPQASSMQTHGAESGLQSIRHFLEGVRSEDSDIKAVPWTGGEPMVLSLARLASSPSSALSSSMAVGK